jgi:hypothetical protein
MKSQIAAAVRGEVLDATRKACAATAAKADLANRYRQDLHRSSKGEEKSTVQVSASTVGGLGRTTRTYLPTCLPAFREADISIHSSARTDVHYSRSSVQLLSKVRLLPYRSCRVDC